MIKTLRWKIFSYLLAFSSFILAILIILQTLYLRETYEAIRRKELDKAVAYTSDNIKKENFEDIKHYIEYKYDVFIKKNNEKFEFKKFDNPLDKKHRREIEQIWNFNLENGEELQITFFAVLSPVESTINTIRLQLFIVAIILIFMALILSIIISKKISKPIEDINEKAKELSKGNFDIKFYGEGYVEIEELSNTLNKATYDLSKVENLRRELLANVSHDLRTPLTLIYGNAETMLDFPDEITKENIQTIKDECETLTKLVNDMLDISKFENGDLTINKTEYSLTNSIKNNINRFKSFDKKYTIDFKYEKDIKIFADEIKINQVIYNLISNAINYSNEDCKIKILQTIEDNFVKIEIIDNGLGIKDEDIENIWDRYYKSKENHKRSKIGTGLGLSIVRKIIKMHGGNCGVKSKLGKGSTFFFTIPMK